MSNFRSNYISSADQFFAFTDPLYMVARCTGCMGLMCDYSEMLSYALKIPAYVVSTLDTDDYLQ